LSATWPTSKSGEEHDDILVIVVHPALKSAIACSWGFVGADEGQHLPYLVLGKICEDGAGGGGGAN
jgi:hypothetical protein